MKARAKTLPVGRVHGELDDALLDEIRESLDGILLPTFRLELLRELRDVDRGAVTTAALSYRSRQTSGRTV